MQQLSVTRDGKVLLALPGKSYKSRRTIGWLTQDGREFHCERSGTTIFRAFGGSIGFNYELMKTGTFETVVVHLDAQNLRTSRENILSRGRFLHFQANHLERQIFLPLTEFGLTPIVHENVQRVTAHAEQLVLWGGAH